MTDPKFKVETDFATLPMFTHNGAVEMAKHASLIAGCAVEVFINFPIWEATGLTDIGEWLKLGYADDGIYYPV